MSRYLVQAASRERLGWLERRTGARFTPDVRGIEALDRFGTIRGQVAYDAWTENACMLHIAADSPIVWRSLLRPGLAYPFVQGNRGVCLGLIAENNRRSCAFTRAVGFTQVARIPDGHTEGVDLLLFQLRKEDWMAGTGQFREERIQ